MNGTRWRDLFTGGRGAVTLTLCLGEGVYAFNSFLVSTAMPSAVRELGGIRFIGWTVTLYLVAALVAGSASGFLKQRIGARRLLLGAGIVFTAGSLCAGAAGSMAMVLAGRLLQGAGEGAIAAACYALIAELLPASLVPRAFGLAAIVWAVAAFGGPVVSGALTEAVSWRAAFLVNLPIIALFLALVPVAVPAGGGRIEKYGLPLGRLLVIAAGIMAIALASVAHDALASAGLIGLGVALLVLAFGLDRRAAGRLFPADAFRPGTALGAALWMTLLMPLGQASTSVYLPISVQTLWGYSPTAAGAMVAVMALSWSGVAVLIPMAHGAWVPSVAIRTGPALLAIGLAGAAVVVPLHGYAALVVCQMLVGGSFGLGWAFLNQVAVAAARPGEQDLAAALVPTVQSAGYALGAALAGLVANGTGYADDLARGGGSGVEATMIFGLGAAMAVLALALGWRAGSPIRP
jgi:MFS family permease